MMKFEDLEKHRCATCGKPAEQVAVDTLDITTMGEKEWRTNMPLGARYGCNRHPVEPQRVVWGECITYRIWPPYRIPTSGSR